MDTRKRYNLEDFVETASAHCPDEFEALMDDDLWVIEYKSIRNQGLKRYPMLLVGTMWYQEGHQSTWARATGLTIEYYYGFRREEFVHPVPQLHTNKVYFVAPLKYVCGRQDNGMTKARRVGQAQAEVVINVVFLKKGLLWSVPEAPGSYLLDKFNYACLNFEANRAEELDEQRIKEEEEEENEIEQRQAPKYPRNDRLPTWSARPPTSPYVKREPVPSSSSRMHTSSNVKRKPMPTSFYVKHEYDSDDDGGESPSPQISYQARSKAAHKTQARRANPSSVVDRIDTMESRFNARLAQEKRARQAQEDKTRDAEAELEDVRRQLRNKEEELRAERRFKSTQTQQGLRFW